jgi:hypothetical protein
MKRLKRMLADLFLLVFITSPVWAMVLCAVQVIR